MNAQSLRTIKISKPFAIRCGRLLGFPARAVTPVKQPLITWDTAGTKRWLSAFHGMPAFKHLFASVIFAASTAGTFGWLSPKAL